MMKVRILHAGRYADFGTWPKVSAKRYEEGDEASFPGDYARGLVEAGLVEAVEMVKIMEEGSNIGQIPEEAETPLDPGELSIAQIRNWLEGQPSPAEVEAVLWRERGGKARVGAVKLLAKRVEGR